MEGTVFDVRAKLAEVASAIPVDLVAKGRPGDEHTGSRRAIGYEAGHV
jgi:hypothetical protein